jgi:hypothetical protein
VLTKKRSDAGLSRRATGFAALRITAKFARHVRFGSKTDIEARPANVRFTPESRYWLSVSVCPLCAKSGHSTRNVTLTLWGNSEFL